MRIITHLGEAPVDWKTGWKPQQNPGQFALLRIRKLHSNGSLCIREPCAPSPVTRVGAKSEQAVNACL